MSDILTDQAWENIWDNIDKHIEEYFRGKYRGLDSIEEEERKEMLLEFIWGNDKVWAYLKEAIADSELGKEIAQEAFDNLPEGPEYEPDLP